ncbi:MAG: hypothetical protein HQM08_21580 [Candidatus Riflebacteria bacterium]|nr:hypothetical protein [Candidatus Riflebacteria bacterium]
MKIKNKLKKGMNLVEVAVVLVIASLMFLPMTRFWFMSQKSAVKGFERLETLTTARIILEKVQRDLKTYCFSSSNRFTQSPNGTYQFLVFPGVEYVKASPSSPDGKVPLNSITYTFDSNKRTLVRTLLYNSRYQSITGKSQISEVVGQNVASFSINLYSLFKVGFFDIDVFCQSFNPSRRTESTHLRTAVRSDYECRLARHLFQIPNMKSELLQP